MEKIIFDLRTSQGGQEAFKRDNVYERNMILQKDIIFNNMYNYLL